MRCIILYFVLLISGARDVTAGAWTQPEGQGQIIVTLGYSSANSALDEGGSTTAVNKFEKYELRAFVEYGLTDWATLIVQPEVRFKEQESEQSSGLGRLDLGLRTRLWQSHFSVFSVEAAVSAPGQTDRLAPLNGGDTHWEVEGRALFGRGFDLAGKHGFLDLQFGYRHRVSEPADEIVIDLTLGLDLSDDVFGMVQSFNRLSVGAANDPFALTQEHKIALSAVYKVDDAWAVQAGVQGTAFGKNVLQERGAFFAVWRKF